MESTVYSARISEDRTMPQNAKTGDLDSPVIRVTVGAEPNIKEFLVRKSVLCSHSEFFKIAMKKEWKEGDERKVALPEDDPEVFSHYLAILRSSDTQSLRHLLGFKSRLTPKEALSEWGTKTCRLYVLAEKLMDDTTKYSILSQLRREYEGRDRYPSLEAVQTVYDGALSGDPARKLLVSLYSENSRGWEFDDVPGPDDSTMARDLSEFNLDLVKSLLWKRALPRDYDALTSNTAMLRDKVRSLEQQLERERDFHDETQVKLDDMTEKYDLEEQEVNTYKSMYEASEREIEEQNKTILDLMTRK
ncbi:hypothetical protein E8E13_007382 [Curvularia kusanoi]|uniref:BTB domain-containing protein n=1 Tax=Curvularia kusanoi TaxID=90978 RepID=A0A9P4T9H2_CURKU|nr:hypothetical protein E8E13_007382 [Curvularia kusanoi]